MKRIFLFIVLGLILFFPKYGLAYESKTTHPLLTQEIVDFYNQNFSLKVNEQDAWWLMRGSSLEDSPPTRTVNHFFDPQNEKGLNGKSSDILAPALYALEPFIVSAKEWANNTLAQATFLGEAYKNSAINPYTRLTQNPIEAITAHTWSKAIYLFIKGEREKSLESLGHVLHLLEDMAVPAHTRNDPHLLGDSYERWAGQFTPNSLNISGQLLGWSPKRFFSLEAYFDNLADYSNKNFFSQDTIGIQSGYGYPKINLLEGEPFDGYLYAFNEDEFGKFRVIRLGRDNLITLNSHKAIDDEKIYQDYWWHLSRQTVLYGAGLIDFFFKEVERCRDDKDFIKQHEETVLSRVKEKLAGLFGGLFTSSDDEIDEAKAEAEVELEIVIDEKELEQEIVSDAQFLEEENFVYDYDKKNITSPASTPKSTVNSSPIPQITKKPTSTSTPAPTPIPTKKPTPSPLPTASITPTPTPISYASAPASSGSTSTINWCNQNNPTGYMSEKKVIINEIAWAGTDNSSSDEWIELKNVSGEAVNIKDWQLIDKTAQIKISFGQKEESTIIPAGGFMLLERTDDNSVPSISADLIYVGGLNNSDEFLKLLTPGCLIVDEAIADSDWIAGDSSEKRTMERDSDHAGWHTYSGNGEDGIFGTAKTENSPIGIDPQPTADPPSAETPTPTPQSDNSQTTNTSGKVLISEFLFDAEGLDAGREFVELYNLNENNIDLDGWKLILTKNETTDILVNFGSKSEDRTIISARSFLLVGLNGYDSANYNGIPADVVRSVSLGQSDEYIYSLGLFNKEDSPVDGISYSTSSVSSIGQSLERKASSTSTSETMAIGGDEEKNGNGYDTDNQSDFITRDLPQPQNSNFQPEPHQPPPKIMSISGRLRENDGMPILSFSLDTATTTNLDLVFKYSNENISESDWGNIFTAETANLQKLSQENKWEIELQDMESGSYYITAKTKDKWGLESDISEIYQFNLPECLPNRADLDHPFVQDISFYSCLGKYWLDFKVVDFPDPLPSEMRNIGFYFLKNKTEEDICHNELDCFQGFESVHPNMLAIAGWGGMSIGHPENKDISSVFIGANINNISDLDFMLSRDQNFHFEVAGFYDDTNNLIPADFNQDDYIWPVVLGWTGNNPWWKRFSGKQSQDAMFFERLPLTAPVLSANNFEVAYNESANKFKFDFQSEDDGKYEIRYSTTGQIDMLNWGNALPFFSGNLEGVGSHSLDKTAGGLLSEKKYFFGLRLKSGDKQSAISRSESYIPYPLLNCSYYSSDLVCDNFNDYDVGRFNDQNGWAGDAKWEITNGLGKRGSNVLMANPLLNDPKTEFIKSFSAPVEKGELSFWIKKISDRAVLGIKISSSNAVKVFQEPFDDAIYLIDSGSAKVVYQPKNFNPNVWQKWYIKWDRGENKYWFKVDGFDYQEMTWPQDDSTAKHFFLSVQAGAVLFEDIKPE